MKKTVADYPELVKEWHTILNGDLTPNNVAHRSNKKYWWICDKKHEWDAVCYNRTRDRAGCPYCTNQKVCKDNCLATSFPNIAKEWHPVKNGKLNSNDVTCFSNKKVWWQCEKLHEWKTSVYNRTSGRNCPFCTNQKVCKDNCLATLFPDIAKEWHPVKNGNLIPDNILSGSHEKFWWQCEKLHEWKSECRSRTCKGSGCPICSESKGEKEVARILEQLNIPYQREFKFDDCKNIKRLPFDFKLNINNKEKIIEYHGGQHYEPCDFGSKKICKHENLKKIQQRDKIKKDFCESRGIPFLEISYKDYDKIEELITKFVET